MSDCALWLALAFLLGGGVGGLLVNEVAWRAQRRDLTRLQRELADHCAGWDAELAKLKAEVGVAS